MKGRRNLVEGKISQLANKLCENLPYNLDFFRQDGKCTRPSETCKYYERKGQEPLCNKQAYVFKQRPRAALV